MIGPTLYTPPATSMSLPIAESDVTNLSADLVAKIDKSIGTTKGDIIGFTASGTPVRRAVGPNGAALVPVSANSDGLGYEYSPQWFPLYRASSYYFCNSSGSTATSNSLTNGTLRVGPWVVTKTLPIVRLGAEFTVAGDANSVYRIGIYADDGSGNPTGAPVLDAGSISTGSGNAGTVSTGGTPGVYDITVSLTLTPGLYWVGGVVQGVTSTQPTMRIVSAATIPATLPLSSQPTAGQTPGAFTQTGVTGALSTWSTSSIATTPPARIHFKTAA
jgi:hypothetical protein